MGGFILKILRMSDWGRELRSWGVMKMNWRFSIFFAMSTSSFMATLRETWSMKTSNSSMTRNGHSIVAPSEMSMARVEKERSPPLRDVMLLMMLASSALSFWYVSPSVFSLCSKSSLPAEPLAWRMLSNSLLDRRQMYWRMRLSRFQRSWASCLSCSPSRSICLQPDSFSKYAWRARSIFSLATSGSTSVTPRRLRALALMPSVCSMRALTASWDLYFFTSSGRATPSHVSPQSCRV
mmetsp:Transcript_4897/g.16667  ORF Transcript_4897/g.16667 Transcript_4897/m.16667 type:complete len:237 (+) Transcript_4897:72-782(+)